MFKCAVDLISNFPQLNPLPETATLAQTATSLIPVSLKGKVQPPVVGIESEKTRLPGSTSHRSSSPIPSWSGEKNRAASTSPRSTPILPPIKPERKLSEDDARHNHHNAVWVFSAPLPGGRSIRVVFPRSVVMRTTKSAILAAKVNPFYWTGAGELIGPLPR